LTEQQQAAVELMASGLNIPAVADALGLHKTTVYRWVENNGAFRRAATAARLDALTAHTVEAREIIGSAWTKLALRFADFDAHWDEMSWTNRIKVMEMMLKHFQTPQDRTSYKETRELKAEIRWPDTGLPIETTANPVNDDESDES
jgi:AcrR family transcriptional regulator